MEGTKGNDKFVDNVKNELEVDSTIYYSNHKETIEKPRRPRIDEDNSDSYRVRRPRIDDDDDYSYRRRSRIDDDEYDL